MSTVYAEENTKPEFDEVCRSIAEYVTQQHISSDLAYETSHYALWDAVSCGLLALQFPECRKLLGPIVPQTVVPNGVPVPGTNYRLDPCKAAFDIGVMNRWLDYNDTWLAAEWGHPSDNLGAILAVADYTSRLNNQSMATSYLMKDVLSMMIKAYEIQGILALENAFNRVGLDHVVLVKLASTAVAMYLLGGNQQGITNALSQVWVDGQSLRTYRHAPNTGSRKSWAAGDASSRGVFLALLTQKGEMGYPSALTAKQWGFYDVMFKGNSFLRERPYGSYVMENILFKISYPAEFHAQTAVEAAVQLHPQIKEKLGKIEKIILTTQEPAVRIISKTGELRNPADRDHCLQYMVAVALLTGTLNATHYEDAFAADPRIDELRRKMVVVENQTFTQEYYHADKRAIGNAIQIFFADGEQTEQVVVEYPIGHRIRRDEGVSVLKEKVQRHFAAHYSRRQHARLMDLFNNPTQFASMPLPVFMDLLAMS